MQKAPASPSYERPRGLKRAAEASLRSANQGKTDPGEFEHCTNAAHVQAHKLKKYNRQSQLPFQNVACKINIYIVNSKVGTQSPSNYRKQRKYSTHDGVGCIPIPISWCMTTIMIIILTIITTIKHRGRGSVEAMCNIRPAPPLVTRAATKLTLRIFSLLRFICWGKVIYELLYNWQRHKRWVSFEIHLLRNA